MITGQKKVPAFVRGLLVTASTTLLLAGCTYRVDSFVDAPDADPGNFSCVRLFAADSRAAGDDDGGTCTLRAAIMEANASFLGTDRIEIPPGTYNIVRPPDAGGGALRITENVVIQGSGAATTILDGNGTVPVIVVDEGAEVTIANLTLRNGDGGGFGGGLRVESGVVELTDAIVRNNFAFTGGGGVVVDNDGELTVRRSAIVANNAQGAFGGGILNDGRLFVFDSVIADNASNRAGGITNQGLMNLRNTTVSGNTALSPDAGVGGISQNGFAVLNNVTITGNQGVGDDADDFRGGGIQTVSDETTVLKNSIVAGNVGGAGPADCVGELSGDSKHNLIGDTTACIIPLFVFTYVLDVDDPGLGPLASNGGPTLTHVLLSDSPARGAGYPFTPGGPAADACEGLDQRGVPRPEGDDACDMGAFEVTTASAFVTGFVLVDADDDSDIRPLLNGHRLDLDDLPGELSIRAATSGPTGSVVFALDDDPSFQTENNLPYALGSDNNGDYHPVTLNTGEHTLRATPFSGMNGGGAAGGSRTIEFEIIGP